MTKSLVTRYKSSEPQVFTSTPPWIPQCTIMEGMFLININPLGSHKIFSDYASFIMQRFIMTQFQRGISEIHIIFDNPGRLENTPKYFEHKREGCNSHSERRSYLYSIDK